MKIKTEKKMRLDELIKYIVDNELKTVSGNILEYTSDYENKVFVDYSGQISTYGKFFNDSFTVEVEEELTEETVIHGASFVYYNELKRDIDTHKYSDESPLKLKHIIRPSLVPVPLAVYKGKQLIWTKEHGIPESGVLEGDNDENKELSKEETE